MKHLIRLFVLALFALASQAMYALDLPVKTINGKQYYYYTVKKGDTVYSLITRFGITRSDLVESNPAAADVLKTGDTLYFAVDKFGDGKPVTVEQEENTAVHEPGIVYHQVRKGETLYGISKKYGVDQESIVDLNPKARFGVKTGSTLRIPVGIQSDGQPAETAGPESAATPAVPPIEHPAEETVETPTTADETDESSAATSDEDPAYNDPEDIAPEQSERAASVAIMLPFMLDSENPDRQALHYTDFYKGLLLAADTLSNRGDSLRIFTYDTKGDLAHVKELLSDSNITNASVIIAPDNAAQLAAIAGAVAGTDAKVINVFNVKDSLFACHPQVIQANTPHTVMYAKAIKAIEQLYPDHIPVILRNENGRNDKAEFISLITAAYKAKGVEPLEIAYDGALISAQIEGLPDDGSRYLLIPTSGNINEFNKFIHAVKTARDASAETGRIALFGYPDWTAFRNDAEAMLHAVDATVFSRFYFNERNFDTTSLKQAFRQWYGDDMIDLVPNQAVLGYDIGNLVIRNLRSNGGNFDPTDSRYTGIQSSFNFVRDNDNEGAGFYNDEIYILRFNPDRRVERLSF